VLPPALISELLHRSRNSVDNIPEAHWARNRTFFEHVVYIL
jgi:hypothetical protein